MREEGKIKKIKPLPPVVKDEFPFELKQGWMWIRIGDIVKKVEYGTSQKASTDSKDVPVFRMNNIQNGKIIHEDLTL